MIPGPDAEPLHNAVAEFVAVQRRLLASLGVPGENVSLIAAAMADELDKLEAALPAADESPAKIRPGDPGQ